MANVSKLPAALGAVVRHGVKTPHPNTPHRLPCTSAPTQPTSAPATPSDPASVRPRRQYGHLAAEPQPAPYAATSVTSWISDLAANASLAHLSDVTVARSKRMLLDTLGVGVIGWDTDITSTVARCTLDPAQFSKEGRGDGEATIWGAKGLTAPASLAAFINGVSAHSMDFDDTWYPATHPSGPVLPAVLALAESMTGDYKPSLQDILVAYNVGIQVQGLLLRCADSAKAIPDRFHPPAVVGVMGSAAACARLLGGGPSTVRHALAIATSFAGAPMANAGTTTKPLHAGKAARSGLEAALLALRGLEGNHDILDMRSGFGAFYPDYDPEGFLAAHSTSTDFILHDQDVAIKRFPTHLGMHWTIDAVMATRAKMAEAAPTSGLSQGEPIKPEDVESILIKAPPSKYINRPLPSTTHEARHSFQFNACTALLDGHVTPESFLQAQRRRPELKELLHKTRISTPPDNLPTFHDMYVETKVTMTSGEVWQGRCDTPYGHWRRPLSQEDLEAKFVSNTQRLPASARQFLINTVQRVDTEDSADGLYDMLKA